MERKIVNFEVKQVDEETGIFEGYAATFTNIPDSYGDIIEKGAFSKTLQEGAKRIKVLWNHNTNEPIGKPIELVEDEHGLRIKAKLSLGVQRAREVLALMKDGVINEMSIGYDTVNSKVITGIRHLTEIKLWDASPVTFAANPDAGILSVKSDLELLLKSGRMLSASNKDKIRAALESLQALLDAAGDDEPEPKSVTTHVSTTVSEEAADEMLSSALKRFDAILAERRIDELLATRR